MITCTSLVQLHPVPLLHETLRNRRTEIPFWKNMRLLTYEYFLQWWGQRGDSGIFLRSPWDETTAFNKQAQRWKLPVAHYVKERIFSVSFPGSGSPESGVDHPREKPGALASEGGRPSPCQVVIGCDNWAESMGQHREREREAEIFIKERFLFIWLNRGLINFIIFSKTDFCYIDFSFCFSIFKFNGFLLCLFFCLLGIQLTLLSLIS